MNRLFAIISIFIALFLLHGCSYFSHKDPRPEQAIIPVPASTPLIKKATLESCDEHCAKHGGIKKKFCLKKCEHKKKRAERKALIALCETQKNDWWARLIHRDNGSFTSECSDH